ncbi:peptidase C14, caspase domain-containing protein [Earliella scabrosa]|nr:peptidase C14, caspase domain-containing protein [Earliella scabrosa]
MPVACKTAAKKALLVGVRYSTNQNLKDQGFLEQPGAHKDTQRLRDLLTTKYGYQDEDISILVDDEDLPLTDWPTYDNIVRGMEDLVAGTERGDHIVFSFSGHGGQVEAREDLNEVDGQDEVLLPIDCTYDPNGYPDRFKNFVRDNDIRRILVNNLPDGVRCTMIFDCCHSGTASDLPSVNCLSPTSPTSPLTSPCIQSRGFAQFHHTVTAPHHDDYDDSPPNTPHMWPSTRAKTVHPPTRKSSVVIEKEKNVTSWSACLDDQVTFGRKSGGIFIKAFTNALNLHEKPTHQDLLQSLRKELLDTTSHVNEKLADDVERYVPPRPQLGSLRPDILRAEFTL